MIDFTHPFIADPGVRLGDHHKWTIDDRPAPGITEVLTYSGWIGDWGGTEEQKKDGGDLHEAIALSVDDALDLDHFSQRWPHLVPKLMAAKEALRFFRVQRGWVEIPVCNRRLWYATAIDAVGQLGDAIAILNWKSGIELPFHSIQSAGEQLALMQDDWADFDHKTARLSVYLSDDGTFNFDRDVVEHTDNREFDWFEAACVTTEGKKLKGLARPEQKARKAKPKEQPPVLAESSLFNSGTKEEGPTGLFG